MATGSRPSRMIACVVSYVSWPRPRSSSAARKKPNAGFPLPNLAFRARVRFRCFAPHKALTWLRKNFFSSDRGFHILICDTAALIGGVKGRYAIGIERHGTSKLSITKAAIEGAF